MKGERLLAVSQLEVRLPDDAEEVGQNVELVGNVSLLLVDVFNQLLRVVHCTMVLFLLEH